MFKFIKIDKKAINSEIKKIEKREKKLRCEKLNSKPSALIVTVEEKIPDKVYKALKRAFSKAFDIVFNRGTFAIEKTFNKSNVKNEFQVKDFALNINPNRKVIKSLKRTKNNVQNMALSTVEGVGLGLLGIGFPDIILFTSMILKGVYETAVSYGFDYDTNTERLFILKLLEASMRIGNDFIETDNEIDDFITKNILNQIDDDYIKTQTNHTADAFAVEMLTMKFIQGLPVIGVLGGLANPVYYHKIMSYVQLKYRKRYLYSKL